MWWLDFVSREWLAVPDQNLLLAETMLGWLTTVHYTALHHTPGNVPDIQGNNTRVGEVTFGTWSALLSTLRLSAGKS